MIGLKRAGNSKGTIKSSRSSHVHILYAFYSCVHLSLRVVILVADQDPVDHLAVLVDLVQPALHVGEALAAGDVVDDDDPIVLPTEVDVRVLLLAAAAAAMICWPNEKIDTKLVIWSISMV